jgi:hypothetical protein
MTLGALLLLVGSCPVAVSQDLQSADEGQEQSDSRAIFVVTTTADSGPGSLRDAINAANATPGNDQITFNISPAGVHTITPLSQLPPLTDPAGVMIDGFTQPGGATSGASPPSSAVLMIEINGPAAGGAYGLWVQSSNNIIQGLCINDFEQDGIRIESGVVEEFVSNNLVFCCFIGTDIAGQIDIGNGRNQASLWAGVYVGNQPGGTTSQTNIDANLISGNYAEGVHIEGPKVPGDVYDNYVTNNYIGTDITGMLGIGNDHEGVCLSEGTHDNQVLTNLICDNGYDGVGIQGFDNEPFPAPPIYTYANLVQDNTIGLDINAVPLPNMFAGVAIGEYGPSQWGYATENIVQANRIAYNVGDGVAVWENPLDNVNADLNTITQNAIFDNGGLGIDLNNDGVTPNDPSDPDALANQELNFPVIAGAAIVGGTTTIGGSIDIDTSPNLATVEVFKAALDPSGHGEGAVYLGSATPDAAGNWSLTTTTLVAGDSVTATTTDGNTNTSEFASCVEVITGEEPWDCFENPPPDKVGGGEETEPNDNCSEANFAVCETAYCGDIGSVTDEDWWTVQLPDDTCYCLHIRLFGDATPGQYAYGGGLNTNLEVWDASCQTMIYSNDDYNGTFPDAVGTDSEYDCQEPTNCFLPGQTLNIRVGGTDGTTGPYLLVFNCYPCECPEPPDTCEYYKQGYEDYCPNGMPDFDQVQSNWFVGSPPNLQYTHCGPVALANCFWWFDSKFEPNPIDPRPFYPGPGNPPANDGYNLVPSFDPSGAWDDHDTLNVVPLVDSMAKYCQTGVSQTGTSVFDLAQGARDWIDSMGLGGTYTVDLYALEDPFGFEFIRSQILESQDVILLLGFYEELEPGICERIGGHFVTCAGVCTNETDSGLCISDPYFDNNEGEPPGPVHGQTLHNDAWYVSGPHGTNHHDRYNVGVTTCQPIQPPFFQLEFTDYPTGHPDLSVFYGQNLPDPSVQPPTPTGSPIRVILEYAVVICPADLPDEDGDGVPDDQDNCPTIYNPNQTNSDTDSLGDVCDNCPTVDNDDQANSDADSLGNACDNCPTVDNDDQTNSDNDSHGDACDNCPNDDNEDQQDSDGDGIGDVCDDTPFEGCEYYKAGFEDYCPNGMPDFDQKRDPWWSQITGNFSWCGPVSLANCFWWFDSKFEPSPVDPRQFFPGPGNPPLNDGYPLVSSYDPSQTWDDHDTSNVVPFITGLAAVCSTDVNVLGTAFSDLVAGAGDWITTVGLEEEYTLTPVLGPEFELLRDSILASQDVILLLGFYELLDAEPLCQRLGGHYVTAAGVCTTSAQICISDPFFDKNEGDPPPGSAHGPTVHDDASLVSGPHGTNEHDMYTAIPSQYSCPTPATWEFSDYPNQWLADGIFTFQNENPIDPVPAQADYLGGPIVVLIDAALIICPTDTGCCIPPIRGNVDYDALDNVNIQDVTYLVGYLFNQGAAPPCLPEADVNGDGVVNIQDVTYLVAYLFAGGPAPVACP